MFDAVRKIYVLVSFLCTLLPVALVASDFVTITTPANGSTVSGIPLPLTGTSSQPNAQVQFIFNGVDIGTLPTDGSGNFSHTFASIDNGNYSLTANLLDVNSVVLATTSITFTVQNPPTISIYIPEEGDLIVSVPMTIVGTASLTSTAVNISVDGTLSGTTTTDSNGNWAISSIVVTNGAHTILAELKVSGVTVASATVDITGKIASRVVQGNVPTTGSGTGNGYSYSVSGSLATVTYTPAFQSTPVVAATGLRVSGASTITISSASTTAVTFMFSAGTASINFTATAFS